VRKVKPAAVDLRQALTQAAPWSDSGWLHFQRMPGGWAIAAHHKRGLRIAYLAIDLQADGIDAFLLPVAKWDPVLDAGPLRMVPLGDGRVAIHAGPTWRFTPVRGLGSGDDWGHLLPDPEDRPGKLPVDLARFSGKLRTNDGWGNIDATLQKVALDCGGDCTLYHAVSHSGKPDRQQSAVVRGSNPVVHVLWGA